MKQLKFHLAQLRKERNMTGKVLSNAAKVSFRTVEHIESGKSNPSIKTLCKLADALEVAVTDLFSYE